MTRFELERALDIANGQIEGIKAVLADTRAALAAAEAREKVATDALTRIALYGWTNIGGGFRHCANCHVTTTGTGPLQHVDETCATAIAFAALDAKGTDR